MGKVYDQVMSFKRKYPGAITWYRLRKHAKVVEDHLLDDEEPLFSFAGQKNNDMLDIFSTAVFCLTNKRIIIGCDHILTGYTVTSITPDMFNDLTVYRGIIFGKLMIDTVKEEVYFTNLDKKSLPDIEKNITGVMMEAKKEYGTLNRTKE